MTTNSLPRTAAAIGLTALWPGSGHALLRRWWDVASWTLLTASVVVVGWIAIDIDSLGELAQPVSLRRALVVNGLLTAARLATLIDVFWTTRAHHSWISVAVALGVVVVVVVPHVYAHHVGSQTIALLETVFVADQPPTQTAVLAAELDRSSDRDIGPSASTVPAAYESQPPPTDSIAFYDERSALSVGDDERFTVLLLGTDQGFGRSGQRTDSIMVVSVDPWTLSTAMFGIPRNWETVPMPDEWPGPAAHPDLANTIYQYGWDNADLFGDPVDPGAEAAMRVFGDLLDIEIDHFIKINMEGFVALIDALGGVEINVTFEVHNDFSLPAEAGYVDVDLEAGVQTLSGLQAMGYARSRKTSNDYHRMGRQRCIVAAIANQLSPAELLLHYNQVVRAIGDHVTTDVPLSLVPSLINVATLVDPGRISTVTFVPPLFVNGSDGQGRRKPHIECIRLAVEDALSSEIYGAEGVTDLGDACRV